MKDPTRKFMDLLDEENIRYQLHDETTNNGSDILYSRNDGDNMKNMLILFFIDDYDAEIMTRIAEVPEIKRTLLMKELNKINNQYKYVNFYITDSGEINVQTSFVFRNCCAAEICLEMARKLVEIADECYPRIMKLVW